MLLTDKKAANEFAQLYRRESTLPLTPKKVGDMKEKLKQEEKQENVPSPCLNSTLKISELNSAIRNLKPQKAPGPDGVSNDMLKHILPQFYRKERTRPTQAAIAQSAYSVVLGSSWNASSPVVSPGSWRPTTYSAPHRQGTVNIAALKISLHSSLKTLKTPSKRSESC